MVSVDINCDLGESFGAYRIGMDREVMPYITSANIACGFHGGDPLVMEETVRLCREAGVHAGAHPGLPDLQGFGRRVMAVSPGEARAFVKYQVGALQAFCAGAGIPLSHVKLHGALYNMAARDYALARAICEGIREIDGGLKLLALSGSQMIQAARDTGLPWASEVFADRAYQADGSLVPRNQPGAVLEDEEQAVRQVVQMVREKTVTATDGTRVPIQADSVCVHGDGPKALAFVQNIRKRLEEEGISVSAF